MTQYVVWIQWGVVGFFALLHFIIGFKRGAKKSLFYSVLSVILMVLVLFLISFISVRPFLSDANLIKLVERFTSLPESVRASILDNPDSLAVIYALVDLVVKLVAFFVIYPIVKWLLTLIIGLPIWRNYEKTKGHPIRVTHIDSGYSILAKNVSGFQVEYKKSVLGRFAGGFFGFLRGALVGLLLLLPIAVMAGFIKGSTVANTEGDELTASNQAAIPEDIQGWLEVVEAFNNSPIGALYNKPHIGNKTLGEATFDLVINSKIKYQDKKQEKVKFTEEFGPIVKAAISLYQNGYLDDGFDLMEISQENLPDIEMLFKAINSSKLVTGIIPTAGPVGVVYFLDSQGFDVNAHPHAENALKEFSNINFKDELDTVYQIIEKLLLTIDNVGELSKFADINYLLETTIEKRTGLAEVLELVDGINSTVLISLVLDYVVTLPEVQEHISWLPNGTETEDYLREALDFYLDNPRFMQEDELFTKIAKIVRVLLVDKASYGAEEKEAGKKYLDYLYDSIKNPNPDIEAVILKYKDKIDDVEAEIREQLALEKDLDPSLIYQSEIDALLVDTIARFIDQAVDEMERVAYRDDLDFVVRHYNSEILAALLNDDDLQDLILDEKTSQMVVDVLEAFVDINTIMEALPLLVDYAIFVQFGDDLSAVSEELSASLKETDWRKDISTLGDVYHKITSFGLKKALRDEKYGPLIDKLISENKLDLDDIIDRLLVESHAINKIISITAPILVDKFVEDDDLKDGILELIKDFDGEKFEYGLELKRVLNAAVEIQKVIPFEELLDLGDLDEDQIIGIIKSFAGLDDDEYQNLKDAITELQVVKRFNKSLFVYLQKTIESDFLAIPEEELPSVFALDRDLTRLLDIVRSVAVTMDKELVDGASYKDINLANVLAADEVKENLEFKKADKDGLLYLLAVHNIVALNNNEGLQDFVAIPEKLISLPYREEVWRTEINTVISALIGTISLYAGDDTPFVLSLNNVSDVGNNWKDLDKTVLTKLIDNYDETLATFFDSKIVLASVTKTLETQLLPILNDLIKDYQASLPVDILDEDNYVTETAINELFEVLFDIVNQYIEFMNVSQLGDFVSEKEISEYLNFYNNLNVETVEDLAYAKFINGFFRDILADEAVWAFITEIIAEALPADLVDLDIVYFVYALEDERVKEDELFYLLGGLRDLKIDPRLLGDDFDMNVVFEYLDSIENTQLASFLRSNLLIELITNALNDPVIEDYAIKLVSDIITNLKEEEINAGTSLDKRIWTEFELDFDSLFASIRRINDQLIPELFDRNEFIRLFNAAKAFLETDINYEDINLALIPQLKEVLYDEKSTIDWLSEVRLIGSVLGEVLTQEGLLEWYADVVNKMLVIDGEQLLTIYNSDFSLFANYVDEKGHLKPEVISSLLTAGAALDWELISDDKITTKAFVDSFLQPAFEFSTNEQDRVYYLYQISFLEEAIESVIESQRFNNLLLEQINKLIDDNLPADANFSHFTKEDLDLNYNLFDEEATRQIFIAIEALKFDDFDELTKLEKIADIARILDLDNTKEITKNIFEIPLVEHLLRVVLTYEDLYILASDMLNDILSEAEIDFIVKPRHLMINEDYLTAEEYTNLVLAVYLSGYDVGVEITPAFIKNLEADVTYDGVTKSRLEHILAANILYGYTDKYLENENARVKVAEIIEDILTKNIKNFNYNINSDLLRAPALALDSEGRLNKAEVIHLVSAFNKLDLESFNELTSISLNYIINDLGEARVVTVFEELLESEWAYFIIGRALRYEGLLELLAEEATKRLKKITDVEHEFSVSDFDIREAKYGIFETSGEYEGYVARTELLALVKLVFAYDWLAIKADSLVSIDNLVRDFLGYTDEAVIDKLLDSKVVVALLDKLLNVETNNLGSYYIEVLNKQLAKRSLTEGLVLGDNIFNISGISGADEVIKTSEIKGLLEIVYLLNLSEGINVERAFTIYSADRNGNDESDFIEIFERTAFIRGLISNVYKDENVKEFALELVEDKVDPKVKEISLLKDLEVDYQLIVEALFAILDENGEFDYLDIGRVLAVLNELNVKGTNDLKLSLVDEVRNNTIDSEDMIYYLANTKAVRYVLSSVLKQPELFSFAAKLVNEKLNTNLETDYQIGSEYDDLLDGYISATHLEALLRAGIGLDISALRNVSLDNLYEIVVGLLDDPYVREGSRLYFVYESLIITDLIKLVVENEALQDWGIGKVNTYLEKVINKFELTDIELLTSADLMISYEGLFDYEAALALLEAVSELNVTKTSDLTKARSINDVAEILKLPYGRETAEELFETPQVRHFIEVFANHDLGYQIVSGIINKYAKKVNLEVSAEDLKVDASYFTSEELTTLLIALYMSGYDVGMAITPALIKNLEEFVVYLNISQERLYFFLDSVIITKLINKAINSENLKGKLLAKVEDKLNDVLNTNLEIPVSLLRAPSVALDGEGNLLRTEIMALVKAFNSLGLGSFNEVTRYTEPRYITENVDTDALLDELLKSEWAYFVIGKAISNDEVLELVAKIATKVVSKLFKEDHQFEAADFYFDDSRYDVLIESGKYEGYLEKEEIKLLARLALEAVPYYDSFSGLGSIPGVIKEMFNDLDENDKSYIDRLFESELFVAAMDKVFNIEHSTMTTNIETLYLSILNSKLSSKGLTLVADDNIFEYHDDVYDNNMMVKKEEVRLLLAAITYLDISDIGLKMILDLVNDEDEEGKTSFDHIFESLIIHSVVSKMMLNERILGVVVDKVNSKQDTLTFTIDLIEVPSEMVEEDLVSVDELKKVLEAFNLMGIESLDLSSVGVEMITNLYGANEVDGKDDLDRLLDSLYIYVIIDRMLKGEAIGNLIATMASGMLDKDITYFDTTPQDDHLDANGGIKKDELRAAVYSLVLLDLTGMPDGDSVTLTDLLALIDQNTDPMTNVDDMHRFLAGDYFHYILQKALTSLSFREMVADGAEIEVDDFDLVSAKDDDGIMSKTEVYNLFRGLKILGINDFSNVEFDIETIINLDTIDFDLLFESSFIYQIIDLTIKDQLDDIPEGALVEDINSKYYDYVKKDELRALLEILKELDATDPNDINAYNVTVGMLRNFLDKDSAIFNRFLSEQIIEELGALNEESYVSGSEKDLTPDELRSFVDALEILLGSEQSLGDLDFGELTVTTNQFNDVLNIEADNDGTHVVNRMLSKAIIEGIDDIPEAAYVLDSDDKDIERTEIEGLQKVINILKLENMSDDINVDIVSVDDLGEIVDVNTLIVNKLVSDSIKGVFDDIPAAAYDDKGVILNSEMKRIVASLTALDVDNVTKASEIDASDITGTKLTGVANAESLIVYRLITTQVGDAGLVIPIEAYDGDDISKDELLALADTLEALGMSVEDTSGIKADTIDDEMLRGVADAESLIVYRLITTQIEGTDLIIPDEAYVGDDISKTELLALADTLEALGMSVEDTSGIEAEDIDDTMLRGVANAESLIVYRLITTQVGDAGLTIPTEAYDGDDISKDELLALADTLESLGMSVEDTSGIEAELIDAEMLGKVATTESYIVKNLITSEVEDKLEVPDGAKDGEGYITEDELLALADTLTELESEGIDDVLELSGVDASYVSVDVLEILTESESKIVRRIVTKTLDNALDEATISVSDDAYDTNDDFTDEELDALIVALGILEVDSLDELFDKEPGDFTFNMINDIKNMDPKSYIIEAMFPGIYS